MDAIFKRLKNADYWNALLDYRGEPKELVFDFGLIYLLVEDAILNHNHNHFISRKSLYDAIYYTCVDFNKNVHMYRFANAGEFRKAIIDQLIANGVLTINKTKDNRSMFIRNCKV